MKSLASFIVETLTPDQVIQAKKLKYKGALAHTQLNPAHTDHFFNGSDEVHESEPQPSQSGEVRELVSQHIGQNISPEMYSKGVVPDPKYPNRTISIGSVLSKHPDEKVRTNILKQYNEDPARAGARVKPDPNSTTYMKTVRGYKVADQTNFDQPWCEGSCKLFAKPGQSRGPGREKIPGEIANGTVAVFAESKHNQTGKVSQHYRSTLQPYSNEKGNVMYDLNAEYGLKKPEYTKYSEDLAKRLSGRHKGGSLIYKIHPDVYNNKRTGSYEIHPDATPKDIENIVTGKYKIPKEFAKDEMGIKKAAISHPNASEELINNTIFNHDGTKQGYALADHALSEGKLSSNHIHNLLDKFVESDDVVSARSILANKNVKPEHVEKIIDPNVSSQEMRSSIARLTNENSPLNKSQRMRLMNNDPSPMVRQLHGTAALVDEENSRALGTKPNSTNQQVIAKAFNDPDIKVRQAMAVHPSTDLNTLEQHVFNDTQDDSVRRAALLRNKHIPIEHAIEMAREAPSKDLHDHVFIEGQSPKIKLAALQGNPNIKPTHLDKAVQDKNPQVREGVLFSKKRQASHLMTLADDSNPNIRKTARQALYNLHTKLNHSDEAVRNMTRRFTNVSPEDVKNKIQSFAPESVAEEMTSGALPAIHTGPDVDMFDPVMTKVPLKRKLVAKKIFKKSEES